MKTINHYKAKMYAGEFYEGQNSALYSFASTGLIVAEYANQYHSEIAEMLYNEHMFLKKDLISLKQLKNYFTQYAPETTKLRDPANIITLVYDNILHRGEKTEFQITWDELIIIPADKMKMFSIPLSSAKELAKAILKA